MDFFQASKSATDHKIWSTRDINGSYSCGYDLMGEIVCQDDENFLLIKNCHCIYFEKDENKTVVGTCWITCFRGLSSYAIFHYSMENATKVNDDVCSRQASVIDTHCEGRFCGRCKQGYGLAAYSYHYTSCIPCKDYGYKNWLIYFTVALLPLTLFYIFMVVFKVSFTSSYINDFVLHQWFCVHHSMCTVTDCTTNN